MKHFIINQVQQHAGDMPNASGTGKFMVVVAVIAVIFAGIIGYLISLDLKLKKQEK
ncbi:MAG: CcmD family protein [bacterium]|nr:CcmD family protein [bacterium]